MSFDEVELLEVTQNDYDSLCSLFIISGDKRGIPFWHERFRLWWDNNPACGENVEKGWILKDGQQIVGFLGNVPSLFQFNGEKTLVYNTTMWEVLPEYRNKSMQLLFSFLKAAKNTIFFCTTPSDEVEKILNRLKFQTLPRDVNDRSVVLINPKNFLKSRLGKKPIISSLLFLLRNG